MTVIILAMGSEKTDQSSTVFPGIRASITTSKSALITTSAHALRRSRPHIWLPPTPFTASTSERNAAGVVFRLNAGSLIGWNSVDYPGPTFSSDSSRVAAMRSLAVTRALGHLKDQKVNFAQAFFERQQTAGLIASSAIKIAKSLRAVRKGNFGDAAQALGLMSKRHKNSKLGRLPTLKQVGDNWLELQYGWKPLLSDVYGAAELLASRDAVEPQRYRVTVTGKASESSRGIYNPEVGIYAKGNFETSTSVICRLDYSLVNPTLAAASGTGITNPVNLAWELVPWSFVVDWFLPVGNYLQSFDAALGYSFLGGSSTLRFLSNFSGDMHRVGYSFGSKVYPYWYGYGCSTKTKEISRIVYASSPLPRFPGLKNPFSLTHLANALALLRGSVR